MATELCIDRLWNGSPAEPDERTVVGVALEPGALIVTVDAPFYGDPEPTAPAGSTDRLWEHEVVELFLLGDGERYLELELGPHGHYLALELEGTRNIKRSALQLTFAARIEGSRWTGTARAPRRLVPPGALRANAYAIHGAGTGPGRRHLAWRPVPGTAPDFHQLDCFGPIALG